MFGQVDQIIWDYAADCGIDLSESEECQSFGFTIPQYGSTAGDEPAKSFEAEQKRRKKEFEKNFEMVELDGGSWKIEVPIRKNK